MTTVKQLIVELLQYPMDMKIRAQSIEEGVLFREIKWIKIEKESDAARFIKLGTSPARPPGAKRL